MLQVKESLGGRVRVILSGAAPLATHVEEYLRVVTCAHVIQGYGMFLFPPCESNVSLLHFTGSNCSFALYAVHLVVGHFCSFVIWIKSASNAFKLV
jgi:hypothetical protein